MRNKVPALYWIPDQGWIKTQEIPYDKKGRPVKNYALAVPVPEIMTSIDEQKRLKKTTSLRSSE